MTIFGVRYKNEFKRLIHCFNKIRIWLKTTLYFALAINMLTFSVNLEEKWNALATLGFS